MLIKKELKEETFSMTSNLDNVLDRSTMLYRWYRRTMDDLMSIFRDHPCKNEARFLINLSFYLLKFAFDLSKVPNNHINDIRNVLVSAIPQLFNIEKRIRDLLKGYINMNNTDNMDDISFVRNFNRDRVYMD